ncbi:MAG: hypothetical protein ACREMA_13540 [Longimicrobiales bacterium]
MQQASSLDVTGSTATASSPPAATATATATTAATESYTSAVSVASGSCGSAGCYGPALAADSLANTTIGPYGNRVTYRFRAMRTGYLKSIRVYLLPDAVGYGAGTGGKLLVGVHNDSGTSAHTPATRLASYTVTNPLDLPKPGRIFRLITFPSPPRLISGRLYHIMFSNVDAKPTINYLSVDALFQRNPTTPNQPFSSDVDSAVLLYNNATKAWRPRRGFTPIIQFNFTDGWTEGIGYMEAWVGAPQAIGGSRAVRQRITVSGSTRKIGSVAVRVRRNSGSGALRVRVENSNGTLIEEGNISSTAFPIGSMTWGTYRLRSTRTLSAGRTYHLVLLAPSGTVYQTFPIRKGMHYGFSNTTYFRDGHAQFKSGSTWVGWTQWGATNRVDGDLQFYLHLVP